MTTRYFTVNDFSWVDDTWLAPYCGWLVRIDWLKDKRVRLTIDSDVASHDVTEYPFQKLLTRTKKPKNQIKVFSI